MSTEPAGLYWTGHALLDVGIAGLCVLCKRTSPKDLTLADLDKASDFIEEHYFSGALDPYLIVIFLNGGYCGPNKVDNPKDYEEIYRAHRVLPQKHVDPSPHYSRLMVRGSVDAILDTPATPVPLSRSRPAAAGPHVLCWEWSGGRRTS